ncbi:DUF2802 domain-containing protein [Spongiibacter sp. KMU-158]|uniref:DUF2802 domain-containing protein n=1 Tax=Spongiibacter pelagi TaxID=2760804 RepID=A0A927BZI5_9GAMM|nr:DUF2802 domain-containing protein [Spongiibacter pelagi]MBD2858450.1 DUF2802 domain-containing protein [Spongiibacter pelagi]
MDINQWLNQISASLTQLQTHELIGGLVVLSGVAVLLFSIHQRRIVIPWVQRQSGRKQAAINKNRGNAGAEKKAPLSLEQTVAALQQRLDWQNTAISLMGERILALEEYLEMVGNRAQSDKSRLDERQYHSAIALLEQGAELSQLAKQCGISPSEAELLAALHRKSA